MKKKSYFTHQLCSNRNEKFQFNLEDVLIKLKKKTTLFIIRTNFSVKIILLLLPIYPLLLFKFKTTTISDVSILKVWFLDHFNFYFHLLSTYIKLQQFWGGQTFCEHNLGVVRFWSLIYTKCRKNLGTTILSFLII